MVTKIIYKRYRYFNNKRMMIQRKVFHISQKKQVEKRVTKDKEFGRISESYPLYYHPEEIFKKEDMEV